MTTLITIALKEGAEQVPVLWQGGVWAVHRALGDEDKPRARWYAVTHVPTGRALRFGLTQRQALRLGKTLHREAPNWGDGATLRSCPYAPIQLQQRLRQLAD